MKQFAPVVEPLFEFFEIQQRTLGQPAKEPLGEVVRMIAKSMHNSLGALALLALNGYGTDALKIARSMFEGLVTIRYLIKNPASVDDFLDFDWVRRKRLLDHFSETDPNSLTKFSEDAIREVEENFKRVTPKFTRKGRLRHKWSKASIRDMAEQVGMSGGYPTFYSSVSSMHHLDSGGLSFQSSEYEGGRFDIEVAPSEKWVSSAIQAGYTYAVGAMEQCNRVSHLGIKNALDDNMKKFMAGLDSL